LTGNSAFCSRIDRDLSDPTAPFIDLIDAGFMNRDNETARGVDINVAFDDTWTFFDRPFDVGMDIVANRQLERSTLFVDDEGNADFDTFEGEWGYPEWRVQSYFRVDYDDIRFVYEMRYTGSVHQDPGGVDDFDEAHTGFSDTCIGPPDDVLCRDYGDADNYILHNVSLFYYGDQWTFGGGIRNMLDESPPVVDGTEIQSYNNTPLGYGYDLRGRTYFVNVAFTFGGGQ
jgi:iron complex outermembrane receptor protein